MSERAVRAAASRPTVLVIGATSAVGLATASALAHDESRDVGLALAAGEDQALGEVATELPGEQLLVPLDVTAEESVERAVHEVLARYGRLDAVVVTAAQRASRGSLEEVPAKLFNQTVNNAVGGTANVARAVLPVFRQQGHGTLVVVSSLLAGDVVPSMSAYVAATWGQLGLVQSLQLELREEPRLHVCLVSPGLVEPPVDDRAAAYATRTDPDRLAAAVISCLDRPRRHVQVRPAAAPAARGLRIVPAPRASGARVVSGRLQDTSH